MPKRKDRDATKAKSALTEVDLKKLWDKFADALTKQNLDPDAYRGSFHENIILTESYDTNRKIVADLASRITVDDEAKLIDPKPIRIEMPPPKASQTHEHDSTFQQENTKLAYDQQLLDEKLYEYIVQRNGEDISLTQASEHLGAAREEIDKSIDRLCNAGRLPRPTIPTIQEQTQACVYCSAEIPLGSKFCIRCGQPQETQLGMETPPSDGAIDLGAEPPPPDFVRTEDTRARERGLRFDLLRHLSERKAREQRPADMWQRWRPQVSFPSGKPFNRFGTSYKPARPRICPRCRHILGPTGYCDHCRRHR